MFRAYAKINLGLRICNKRPDGFHDIETVFHRIDLYDTIRLEPSSEIRVVSSSQEAPGDATNICYRAAKALRESLGVEEGVTIHIDKQIPVGAGLGGGSSDAATVLLALPEYWGCSVRTDDLSGLAIALGSDVPYFLRNGSALATGRGEVLEYFRLVIPYWILLCNPNIHLSTAWAYRNSTPRLSAGTPDLRTILERGLAKPAALRRELKNDFEPAVFKAHPDIAAVKDALVERGAVYASMSGSGSSVYGLFGTEEGAKVAAADLGRRGYRTFLTAPAFAV